jgi:ribose transport system permease protein
VKHFNLYNLTVMIVALAAASAVAVIQPLFFTIENLTNVSRQATPLMIFAMAQMVPILTKGLDLSQGGVVVATSVSYALLAQNFGTGPAMILALAVGLVAGALNGVLIAGFGISPFVVTFGVGSILQGLALVAANGQPISTVPGNFSAPFYSHVLRIPTPLIVAIAAAFLLWFVLEKMLIGRRIIAVGSNERAAFLSGIPVRITLVTAYAIAGAMTSIGAVLLSSRISSGHPTAGSDTALQAVAAAVIGGVSLYGGRGTVLGAVLGAVFLTLIANALNLLNVSSFLQLVAAGTIIIVAVVADRLRYGPKTSIGVTS